MWKWQFPFCCAGLARNGIRPGCTVTVSHPCRGQRHGTTRRDINGWSKRANDTKVSRGNFIKITVITGRRHAGIICNSSLRHFQNGRECDQRPPAMRKILIFMFSRTRHLISGHRISRRVHKGLARNQPLSYSYSFVRVCLDPSSPRTLTNCYSFRGFPYM